MQPVEGVAVMQFSDKPRWSQSSVIIVLNLSRGRARDVKFLLILHCSSEIAFSLYMDHPVISIKKVSQSVESFIDLTSKLIGYDMVLSDSGTSHRPLEFWIAAKLQ